MRGPRSIGVVAAVAAIVAGCGSTGRAHHAPRVATAPTGSGAVTSTAGAAPSSNGEATRTARQILRDAQAALRGARSLRVQGTIADGGRSMRVSLVEGSPRTYDLSVAQQAQSFEIVVQPAQSYLRANAAFWRANSHGGRLAQLLEGRWFIVPGDAERSLTASFVNLQSRVMARCLGENVGTLRVAGRATVDGTPAVVVHDDGNVPGGGAGDLYVATVGTPYPLRLTGTGDGRPGGRVDVCNDGKGGATRGSLTLSAFDHAPPVRAPRHAIAIPTPGQHTV